MIIRPTEPVDTDYLILLAEMMRAESPAYRRLTIDPEKLKAIGDQSLLHPDRFCIRVAEHKGRIVGFILGYVNEVYFGHDLVASDLGLFVPQTNRGGRIALALIKAFEDWARDNGAGAVQLGITTGVQPERTGEFYQHLGYSEFGIVYRKQIESEGNNVRRESTATATAA
jgi:GNAT superfamily N-acetyltransferase